MQKPIISIVFLNFNRIEETRHTLARLREMIQDDPAYEIIAVDNASSDGTGDYLRGQTDSISVIHMPENQGIAGYNEGFRRARGDYILVLDDDSYPKDKETLERIAWQFSKQAAIGVVACCIENRDFQPVQTWHLPESLDREMDSMAFVGCGFAIRRDLFAQTGWYPENFFLYQNELEVAIQVRKRGFRIRYDPACRVVHREAPGNRHSWRRVYFPTRNTIWLIRRYFPRGAGYLIFSRLCFGLIRALQSGQLTWYIRAAREALFTPIPAQPLSAPLRREFHRFVTQNSLFHHLIGRA